MKILSALRRRLREKRGFTLSETLITVLILLMVSAIVAGGVPAAANAYYKIIDAANAQILLTDTVTSLRSELAVAINPVVNDSTKEVTYTNNNSGWTKTLKNSESGILTREINNSASDVKPFGWNETDSNKEHPLVQTKMSGGIKTSKLVTSYGAITYSDGVFTIQNLKVTKKDNTGDQIMVEIRSLTIDNIVDYSA